MYRIVLQIYTNMFKYIYKYIHAENQNFEFLKLYEYGIMSGTVRFDFF